MDNSLQSQSMLGKRPLVTVGMPIYNAGIYLRYAVLSIIKQRYQNWELLIIDDGSTDGSLDLITDIHDNRIFLIKDNVNKGLAVRLNEAIDLAKGEYFARMDQDDIAFSDRFEKQLNVLLSDKTIDLNAAQAITIDSENNIIGHLSTPISHDEICLKPWRSIYMSHPTWMGKIEWFKKHYYSNSKPYCTEDQELLLRTYNESKFSACSEILLAYRVRQSNSFKKLIKTRMAMIRFQSVCFFRRHQFHYIILSGIAFGIRFFLDAFNQLRKTPYYPYKLIQPNGRNKKKFQELMLEIDDKLFK